MVVDSSSSNESNLTTEDLECSRAHAPWVRVPEMFLRFTSV